MTPHPRADALGLRTVPALLRAAVIWAAAGFLLSACVLASEGRLQRYQLYSVLSGSMAPTVEVGDLVVARIVPPNRLDAGELATFLEPGTGKLITHRVQSIIWHGNLADVVTRGDANDAGETWSVDADDRVGEVVLRVPRLGYVVGMLAAPAARLALGGIAVVLASWTLVVLWRPDPAARSGPRLDLALPRPTSGERPR